MGVYYCHYLTLFLKISIVVFFYLYLGLHLTLDIHQDMYVSSIGRSAGARVLINDQYQMPFPEEDGHHAPPGFVTAFGLRKVNNIVCITGERNPVLNLKGLIITLLHCNSHCVIRFFTKLIRTPMYVWRMKACVL